MAITTFLGSAVFGVATFGGQAIGTYGVATYGYAYTYGVFGPPASLVEAMSAMRPTITADSDLQGGRND